MRALSGVDEAPVMALASAAFQVTVPSAFRMPFR
jgi:hypothetical protein